jgi:hypothetical protein
LDTATSQSKQETHHESLESEKLDIGRRVHEEEHDPVDILKLVDLIEYKRGH